MPTRGFEVVYLETHNWGKSAAFWQASGFKMDFEQTDHGHSGIFALEPLRTERTRVPTTLTPHTAGSGLRPGAR